MPHKGLGLKGLIAATFTPLHTDGTIHLNAIPGMVDFLIDQGIAGFYILGSTGEGNSLTMQERCMVTEHFLNAVNKRVPTIVQVGHESLQQAAELAAHAQQTGAEGISAVSPVYFKPASVEALVQSMEQIANGADKLPFYYYHIPHVTGVNVNVLEFLKSAEQHIPTMAGIKFTSSAVHEFQACLEYADDRMQILWGLDEMLLSGLCAGATTAVGSTYNFAAPVYQELLKAWHDGDPSTARKYQAKSQLLVRTFVPYGPRSAQKAIMKMIGQDCGPVRLPNVPLTSQESQSLENDLRQIGLFDWI